MMESLLLPGKRLLYPFLDFSWGFRHERHGVALHVQMNFTRVSRRQERQFARPFALLVVMVADGDVVDSWASSSEQGDAPCPPDDLGMQHMFVLDQTILTRKRVRLGHVVWTQVCSLREEDEREREFVGGVIPEHFTHVLQVDGLVSSQKHKKKTLHGPSESRNALERVLENDLHAAQQTQAKTQTPHEHPVDPRAMVADDHCGLSKGQVIPRQNDLDLCVSLDHEGR
mmetsp:Transcript_24809/g.55995  ORF Transcript_24809/g.55995 Transcript_24809/m.55995 type:complete len:228 (+) Transcript_24809:368-1051(+)